MENKYLWEKKTKTKYTAGEHVNKARKDRILME